jgi:hypothetical protein
VSSVLAEEKSLGNQNRDEYAEDVAKISGPVIAGATQGREEL